MILTVLHDDGMFREFGSPSEDECDDGGCVGSFRSVRSRESASEFGRVEDRMTDVNDLKERFDQIRSESVGGAGRSASAAK